jgi:hypothetical protein
MQYTIKKSEVLKLAAAREIQTREAAESYFRETGFQIKGGSAEVQKEWANVKWVNGSTFELAVPIGKLAKWAGLLPAAGERMHLCEDGLVHPVKVSDEIAVEILLPSENPRRADDATTRLRLVCGGSEIAVVCTDAGLFGSPIPVVAPASGGEFTVQAEKSVFHPDLDVMQAMKAARKSASAQKKDAKRRKAFASARQSEKSCLADLKTGAAAYVSAVSILAGGIAPEIARQRLTLKARRLLRLALLTPEIMPAWLPETYLQEHREMETVYLLDASGNPIVREMWQDYYNTAKAAWVEKCKMDAGVAEYVGEKYTAPIFNPAGNSGLWIESEDVENNWTETVDAHAEFAGFVAAVVAARGAVESYKPRVSKFPAYHRVNRGRHAPLLKHEKLAVELKAVQSNLESFIRNMFSNEAERNGLPSDTGQTYFRPERNFSRSKITARNWPERKGGIVTRFMIARDERTACESDMMTAGTVRARLAIFEGKPGASIFVSASEIERVFQKAFDKGASVEILASKNPAYPVGIIAAAPVTVAIEGGIDVAAAEKLPFVQIVDTAGKVLKAADGVAKVVLTLPAVAPDGFDSRESMGNCALIGHGVNSPAMMEARAATPVETSAGDSGFPEVVKRVLYKGAVEDIGQFSAVELKALKKAVRKGHLEKGYGGAFPKEKTTYCRPGFDLVGYRKAAFEEMKAIAEREGRPWVVKSPTAPDGKGGFAVY